LRRIVIWRQHHPHNEEVAITRREDDSRMANEPKGRA
jgi:hypothetical protein